MALPPSPSSASGKVKQVPRGQCRRPGSPVFGADILADPMPSCMFFDTGVGGVICREWLLAFSLIMQTSSFCQELSKPWSSKLPLADFLSFLGEVYCSRFRAVILASVYWEWGTWSSGTLTGDNDSRRVGFLCKWQKGKQELILALASLFPEKGCVSSGRGLFLFSLSLVFSSLPLSLFSFKGVTAFRETSGKDLFRARM